MILCWKLLGCNRVFVTFMYRGTIPSSTKFPELFITGMFLIQHICFAHEQFLQPMPKFLHPCDSIGQSVTFVRRGRRPQTNSNYRQVAKSVPWGPLPLGKNDWDWVWKLWTSWLTPFGMMTCKFVSKCYPAFFLLDNLCDIRFEGKNLQQRLVFQLHFPSCTFLSDRNLNMTLD